jgi:hypothetical protein
MARTYKSGVWLPHNRFPCNPQRQHELRLAGTLGLKGDIDEARAALTESIKIRPEIISLARWREYSPWMTNPEHWALRENAECRSAPRRYARRMTATRGLGRDPRRGRGGVLNPLRRATAVAAPSTDPDRPVSG